MSATPRKERRMKFWSEKLKSRATKREGLRPNPSVVNPFVITAENKGGFKPSDQAKNILSSSTNVTPARLSQTKTSKSVTENRNDVKSSNGHQNNAKSKDNVKSKNKNNKVKNDTNKKKSETNSKQKSENSPKKAPETKYVLFIGNLPNDVTKEDLEEHFRKTGGVKNIRIPQDKAKQCSRGFAFIEFKDRISHGIALRLHHTTLKGRKINVEFTSIGGKSDKRKEKLKRKNEALSKFKMPLDS